MAETATIARLHSLAQVVERNYEGETARFKARIPPHLRSEFQHFIVETKNGKPNGHVNGKTKRARTTAKKISRKKAQGTQSR